MDLSFITWDFTLKNLLGRFPIIIASLFFFYIGHLYYQGRKNGCTLLETRANPISAFWRLEMHIGKISLADASKKYPKVLGVNYIPASRAWFYAMLYFAAALFSLLFIFITINNI